MGHLTLAQDLQPEVLSRLGSSSGVLGLLPPGGNRLMFSGVLALFLLVRTLPQGVG